MHLEHYVKAREMIVKDTRGPGPLATYESSGQTDNNKQTK